MQPKHGGNLYTTVVISFAESYTGTKRTLQIDEKLLCFQNSGMGIVRTQKCSTCQGTCFVQQQRSCVAVIPAGVDTGTSICVAAEGDQGIFGGSPGDLYVQVVVRPNPAFGRNKADLYISAKVERSLAVRGGIIQVSMPDGMYQDIHIPKGTSDGTNIRVRGAGFPIPGNQGRQCGHLNVAVKIIADQGVFSHPEAPRSSVVDSESTLPMFPKTRIGTRLGNYQILSLLGSGGFANVFLAEHYLLHTYAAIKLLRDPSDLTGRKAFLQEARIIASLKHSQIVQIIDFGIEPGTDMPYLIMEYAPDGPLCKRHPGGSQLPLDLIVSYVLQIADALDYAHEQKVIHRDVKPLNLLFAGDRLLLSDFGIAVAAHTTQSLRTQSAIGTITYMAPEQIQEKPCPASDQYSLAVITYELATGAPPFTGNAIGIAMSHISEMPLSLCARIAGFAPEVEQVIFRALAKDPEQRFPSVGAFASALWQFVE